MASEVIPVLVKEGVGARQECLVGRPSDNEHSEQKSDTIQSGLSSSSSTARPAFEDLPLDPNHPKASAWDLWGQKDELGTLNILTPEVVRQASQEVREGKVIPLKSVNVYVARKDPC